MNLLALSSTQQAGGQLALAALLGVVGFYLLLPRPRGRFVPGGIAACLAGAAVLGAWLATTFGRPMPDLVGTVLFYLFASGALIFGTVLVVQRNPARGAIAFAFVILSTCGLFLLLAAPFLMAATIIIYAGAIIVTFLFVLMLSQAGVSDENDRTREPLYGSFAGFAFVGLVLFTLHQTSLAQNPPADDPGRRPASHLLAPVVTGPERDALADALKHLEVAQKALEDEDVQAVDRVEAFEKAYLPANNALAKVVGGAYAPDGGPIPKAAFVEATGISVDGSLRERLEKAPGKKGGDAAVLYREDPQGRDALKRAAAIRALNAKLRGAVERAMLPDAHKGKADPEAATAAVRKLRDEVALLRGAGDLPANNVRNLGFVLYSDYLLAIELAGTLLLVAVIGAVSITHRKAVAK